MSAQNDFDGIKYREERKSPLVFRILFYGLIIWGVVFSGYFLLGGWSSVGEFAAKKQAKSERLAKAVVPGTAALLHREGELKQYLATGKTVFAERCASCHGPDAKGVIGPDLTRKDFKYGKSETALLESISKGREGGMPAFANELSHEQLEGVVRYILSL
jgi:cytochrome c oxidase cbb3-type subunit 3